MLAECCPVNRATVVHVRTTVQDHITSAYVLAMQAHFQPSFNCLTSPAMHLKVQIMAQNTASEVEFLCFHATGID